MEYIIANNEIEYNGKPILYTKYVKINPELMKDMVRFIRSAYPKTKNLPFNVIKNRIKLKRGRSKPKTFPKFSNNSKVKIKGYSAVNPKLIEIIWTPEDGWLYNFENVGHKIQWIPEKDIEIQG